MQYIMYVIYIETNDVDHCICPEDTQDLSQGQELVLSPPLPAEEVVRGSPGEGDETAQFYLRVQSGDGQLWAQRRTWAQACPPRPRRPTILGLEKEEGSWLLGQGRQPPSSEAS